MPRLFSLSLAAAFLFPAAGMAFAQNPSFSCRGVDRCPERVICDTPELARMDNAMAGLYFTLQGMASRPGARALLENQRDWLASRNDCGCNASCLVSTYSERISALRSVIGSR
jgi:uncharacterized protein